MGGRFIILLLHRDRGYEIIILESERETRENAMSYALIETTTAHDGTRTLSCLALYETAQQAKKALAKVCRAHQQCDDACDCVSTSTFAQIEFADDQDHHTTICLRVKQA